MNPRRKIDTNVLVVLAAGFALTIILLVGSGYLGIQAMEQNEARRTNLVHEQRISARLIEEIQGEEAGLSNIFYALLRLPGAGEREVLLARLALLEENVHRTLDAALSRSGGERWGVVQVAVEQFIGEVRRTLLAPPGRPYPMDVLYQRHEALVTEMAALVAANYENAVDAQSQEDERSRKRLRDVVLLLGIALLLSVVCAAGTVYIASQAFRRIKWQARELSRLSGHMIETQETTVRRLSRELHDEFGQILNAIEANLVAIPAISPELSSRVEDCLLLVKDAMGSVRELSQLLRPSLLDDFGLGPSLQWLADSFTQRTGVHVWFRNGLDRRLPGETETHLFRIAQEALTNVSRHSSATEVEISLMPQGDLLRLTISDNGHGFQPDNGHRGLGLIGMRERVRAAGGEVEIHSSKSGVTIIAEVPFGRVDQESKNSSTVGG